MLESFREPEGAFEDHKTQEWFEFQVSAAVRVKAEAQFCRQLAQAPKGDDDPELGNATANQFNKNRQSGAETLCVS